MTIPPKIDLIFWGIVMLSILGLMAGGALIGYNLQNRPTVIFLPLEAHKSK